MVVIFGLVFAPTALAAGGPPVILVAPTISNVAVSNITQTSADLSADVNQNGINGSAWLDTSGGSCTSQCGMQMGFSGTSTITYTLTGLTANTSYSFTASAMNGTFVTSLPVNFTTASAPAPVAPTLSGVSATAVTTTTATLNGTVNPNGTPTAAWFDTSGGACTSGCGNQGGINSTTALTYVLTGLTPNTAYSFQMLALNSGGPTQSSVINFTTQSVASPTAPIISGVSASAITTTTATLNGTVNPNGSATSAWFDTSGGNCTSNCGNVGGINSTTALTYVLTGLTPNTPYSFQMLALNSGGPAQSSVINFTTAPIGGGGLPIMTTTFESSVTKNSAVLNGDWDANGASVTVWFEWGPTVALGTATSPVVQGIGNGSTSDGIAGLNPSTVYYFRIVGQNSNGTTQGSIMPFTTSSASGGGGGGSGGGGSSGPSVTTKDATGITAGSATLNGYITPKNATARWFQWGTSASTLTNNTTSVNIVNAGDVSDVITGLQPNTTYFFRLAASNSNGTVNGQTLSFKTPEGNPLKAITSLASTVGQTTAKINGLVLNAGASSDVWFEYGRTASLGYSTVVKSASGATANVSNVLGNLSPNIIYFFRIVAKNSIGEIKGEIKIFKTLSTTVAPVTIDENTDNSDNQNLVSLKIEAAPLVVAPSDNVNYTVTYKNLSGKVLKDVVVRVIMPNSIDFASSSIGNYSSEDRTLSANIGSLDADEEGILTLSGTVSQDVADKDVLVTTASIVFTNTAGTQGDALDYALIDVAVNQNLLPAAAFFGSGFLPSTLLGWMVLLLVALGLVMLGRKFYGEVNWANALVSAKGIFKKDTPPTNLPQ